MSKERFDSIGFDAIADARQKAMNSTFPPLEMNKKLEERMRESFKKSFCQLAGVPYKPPYKRVDYLDFTHEKEDDLELDDMDYVIRLPILQAMLHGNWGRYLPHVTDLRSFLVAYKDAERKIREILESEDKEIL